MNITALLPDDILNSEILPRLPAKSVARFKCVCKQLKIFLSTDEFANKNLHHQTVDQSLSHHKLLFLSSPSGPSTFSTFSCESPNHCLNIRPIPFVKDNNGVCFLASCNGLVCVTIASTHGLVHWNPLTSAHKNLSNVYNKCGFFNPHLDSIGFYVDSSNDYRLLHMCYYMGIYIYSRRSDSWRKIEYLKNNDQISMSGWAPATFLGGSLYFLEKNSPGQSCVLCFDVNSEKFREILSPCTLRGLYDYGCLVVIKGCIHLCHTYQSVCERAGKFVVESKAGLWRMDGDVWTKITIFHNEKSFKLMISHICETRNGNWIAMLVDGPFTK